MSIGANIKAHRELQGLSLTALAEVAGIAKSGLHELENKPRVRVSAETLYRIALALDCRMESLMGLTILRGSDNPESPLAQENLMLRRRLARIATALADVEE